jgi:hypothetical protein
MNRRQFLKYLAEHNCYEDHEGALHTIVKNFSNGCTSALPRHRELKRGTVRAICKDLEIPPPF